MDVDGEESMDQAVKKLVRYALACEYQRITIKRTGISEKGQYCGLHDLFDVDIRSSRKAAPLLQTCVRGSTEAATDKVWHGDG